MGTPKLVDKVGGAVGTILAIVIGGPLMIAMAVFSWFPWLGWGLVFYTLPDWWKTEPPGCEEFLVTTAHQVDNWRATRDLLQRYEGRVSDADQRQLAATIEGELENQQKVSDDLQVQMPILEKCKRATQSEFHEAEQKMIALRAEVIQLRRERQKLIGVQDEKDKLF